MGEAIGWDGAIVTKMIEERRFDEVADRVAEVLSSRPGHLPASLARARLLIARGEIDEAVALTERLAANRPGNKWVTAVRIDALVAAGRPADARAVFLAIAPPQPDEEPLVTTMLNAVLATDPVADSRIEFLERAIVAWPDSHLILLKLANQTFLDARGAEAAGYLARAEALGPIPAWAKRLKEGLVAVLGDHEAAVRYLDVRAAENPDDAETARRLVRALAAAGDFEVAARRLEEAVQKWPNDWLVLYRVNRTFVSAEQDEAIFTRLQRAEAAGGRTDPWLLQFAQFALRTGRTEMAAERLANIGTRPAMRHISAPLVAALDRTRELGAGRPSRVGVDMSRDVEVVEVDGAQATLIVFGSLVGGIGHLPFGVVDPILSRLPINVVYLRDLYGLAFLRGVAGLGEDEAATVRALAALVDSLGAERVITTGSSIAGYAATRYGLAIGADATLSFAGPVKLDLETGITPSASRPTSLGMQELRNTAGGTGDLSGAIAEAADRFALTVVVGSDYAPDMDRASVVEAFDNAEVIVLPGVEHHFAALAAIAEDRYLPLLERLIRPANDRP